MSLTSDLKTNGSFVRTFVDAHFAKLSDVSRECNRELRPFCSVENPHAHKVVSMLVGTAIDYRIRGYFRRGVHRANMVQKGIFSLQRIESLHAEVAGKSGKPIIKLVKNPWFSRRKKRVAERLLASFQRFAANVKLRRKLDPRDEERMCRYCILFAYLDWIGRAPFGNSATERMILLGQTTIAHMLRGIDPSIVADVVRLSTLFAERQHALFHNARNVTIGRSLEGSADVFGGADFDLIINGCLLDFKASVKARISTDILRQLVGYWLLDYSDKYKIETVGVILMRHGQLLKFDIRNLLSTAVPAPSLRAEFRDGLRRDTAERKARYDAEFEARLGR